jgi:uncharacterized protein YndB with AHSA1/START domain
METKQKTLVTASATVRAHIDKVWRLWTQPKHIRQWNHASDDWHSPTADNDLRVGGKFLYRMESVDGTVGFDLSGVYDEIKTNELIAYTLEDGRHVRINFTIKGGDTRVVETFEAEDANAVEIQQSGWQAILNNFKKYAEET